MKILLRRCSSIKVYKLALLALLVIASVDGLAATNSCVVLIHGLARTSNSMNKMAAILKKSDFDVVNIDYESRQFPIDVLAEKVILAGLEGCRAFKAEEIHFVTHSLGGILVRHYLESTPIPLLGRVVMLAPPNQGSEVVDKLRNVPGYEWFNGPAGNQLGTGSDSVPKALGKVDFELAVIAGTKTFNPLLSQLLPNPDDGKVSVANARVDGMCWFLTVEESHPFIMKNDLVIGQVLSYLSKGSLEHSEAERFACPAIAQK